MKNRKGFTLIEMMCVVAIIIFLSGVVISNAAEYMKKARDLDASVEAHSAQCNQQQTIVDGYLMSSRVYESSGTANTSLIANPTVTAPTETEATYPPAPSDTILPPPSTQPTTPPTAAPTTPPTTAPTTAPTTQPQPSAQAKPETPAGPPAPAEGSNIRIDSMWKQGDKYVANCTLQLNNKASKIEIFLPNGVDAPSLWIGNYTTDQDGNTYIVIFTSSKWNDARQQSFGFQIKGDSEDAIQQVVVTAFET